MPNSKSYRELHDRVARHPAPPSVSLRTIRQDTLAEIGLPEPASCESPTAPKVVPSNRVGFSTPLAVNRRC